MDIEVITQSQIKNRKYWVDEISKLSGNFGLDSDKVEQELSNEIAKKGIDALLGHLRLCGAIPEKYGHDTSEEKLYSKYTDTLISKAFEAIGLASMVLKARADAADVECFTDKFSFVADAKAFRLSRTAKNQKDFKLQAMDNWKRGKPFAMVVCPIYQLPARTSQIYQQASSRSVCIFSYTHMAALVRHAKVFSKKKALDLLYEIFKTVEALHPSKDSTAYWQAVNRKVVDSGTRMREIWIEEKKASNESILLAKEEALEHLASERERIIKLSRKQAIKEVLKASKIENRIKAVKAVGSYDLLSII